MYLYSKGLLKLNFSSPYDIDAEQCIKDGTFSAQTHIGSLGKFFRADASGLSKISTPYLKADLSKTNDLRNQIRKPNRIVCGISWRSKNIVFGADKSITLDALYPILSLGGIDFVDLQYGDTAEELKQLQQSRGIGIQHLAEIDNKNDIDSLAALISACDIVITISNVTAHVAAALGKPTLVMLPNSPSLFWYWHRESSDSPWYPTAILIRQQVPNNWSVVLKTVEVALREFRDHTIV